MKLNYAKILKEAKLKITPARLKILGFFKNNCQPLNVETILKKIKKKDKIDAVTVYRTISTLTGANILKVVDLRKNSEYYELAFHHHHHFVCTKCGYIETISDCNIGSLLKKIVSESKKFSTVDSHSFELFGLCQNCH